MLLYLLFKYIYISLLLNKTTFILQYLHIKQDLESQSHLKFHPTMHVKLVNANNFEKLKLIYEFLIMLICSMKKWFTRNWEQSTLCYDIKWMYCNWRMQVYLKIVNL